MPPGGIEHDGSWNTHMNANYIFFNVLSINTGNVISYLVVYKLKKSRCYDDSI